MNKSKDVQERKKNTTFLYFKMLLVLCGMDFTITVVSLWYYLIEDIKTKNYALFYGLVQASLPITALIFSPIFGRIHDAVGSIRHLIFFNLCIVIIGNFLYSLYISVWFVLIGRTLSASIFIIRPLLYGETSKIYTSKELPQKLMILGLFTGVGVAVGPVSVELLKLIDFNIGTFRVHYLNLVGIQMSFLFFIMLILGYFMLFDLSKSTSQEKVVENEKEVLKKEEKPLIEEDALEDNEENIASEKHTHKILPLISDPDYILIVFTSLFNWTNGIMFEAMIPIVVRETLKWQHSSIIYIFTAKAVASILFFISFVIVRLKSKSLYYMFLFGLICIAINIGVLMFEIFISTKTYIHFSVWLLCIITVPLNEFIEFMYLPGISAQVTPYHMRSFGEGLRSGTVRAGGALAFILSGFGLNIINWYGPLTIAVSLVLFVLFVIRRKRFTEIF